jgi:hypothetical protein
MKQFLTDNHVKNIEHYTDIYNDSVRYLEEVYRPLIDSQKEAGTVNYKIQGVFDTKSPAPYTEETFMNPEHINRLILELEEPPDDMSTYQDIITGILMNKARFKLLPDHLKKYKSEFGQLLQINQFNMKNVIANITTLRFLSNIIYKQDSLSLEKKVLTGNCHDADQYLQDYKQFLR